MNRGVFAGLLALLIVGFSRSSLILRRARFTRSYSASSARMMLVIERFFAPTLQRGEGTGQGNMIGGSTARQKQGATQPVTEYHFYHLTVSK
jgi:hypothetical protein